MRKPRDIVVPTSDQPTIGFNLSAVVWKDHSKPAEDWKSVGVENTAKEPCFVFVGVRFPINGWWGKGETFSEQRTREKPSRLARLFEPLAHACLTDEVP